ncbi:unnamed protein product [Amoebophrya sp. A25]|nr:unnamed protein product [Amoebophrya sp. A25]|eukprot:GSA25T00010491001.1
MSFESSSSSGPRHEALMNTKAAQHRARFKDGAPDARSVVLRDLSRVAQQSRRQLIEAAREQLLRRTGDEDDAGTHSVGADEDDDRFIALLQEMLREHYQKASDYDAWPADAEDFGDDEEIDDDFRILGEEEEFFEGWHSEVCGVEHELDQGGRLHFQPEEHHGARSVESLMVPEDEEVDEDDGAVACPLCSQGLPVLEGVASSNHTKKSTSLMSSDKRIDKVETIKQKNAEFTRGVGGSKRRWCRLHVDATAGVLHCSTPHCPLSGMEVPALTVQPLSNVKKNSRPDINLISSSAITGADAEPSREDQRTDSGIKCQMGQKQESLSEEADQNSLALDLLREVLNDAILRQRRATDCAGTFVFDQTGLFRVAGEHYRECVF